MEEFASCLGEVLLGKLPGQCVPPALSDLGGDEAAGTRRESLQRRLFIPADPFQLLRAERRRGREVGLRPLRGNCLEETEEAADQGRGKGEVKRGSRHCSNRPQEKQARRKPRFDTPRENPPALRGKDSQAQARRSRLDASGGISLRIGSRLETGSRIARPRLPIGQRLWPDG